MSKVSVIGAGNVGATAVYYIAEKNIADIVMVDVVPGMPQSKAHDFMHAAPSRNYNVTIVGSNDYKAIKDSDVVVMTAGIARKPGMDRMDLLKTNVNIAKQAAQAIATYAPNALVIAVSNPSRRHRHGLSQRERFCTKTRRRHGRYTRFDPVSLLYSRETRRPAPGRHGDGVGRPR